MAPKIPERLLPPPVSRQELERFGLLCDQIEDRATGGDDGRLPGLLAEWNQRAGGTYQLRDFTSYHESMDRQEFVKQALMPRPERIDDLEFDEACRVVRAIIEVELSASETAYLLTLLEANLPGSYLSDLLHWPGEWFRNPELDDVVLSPEQVIGYAMARSGRRLIGTPDDLELPHAIPDKIVLPPEQ